MHIHTSFGGGELRFLKYSAEDILPNGDPKEGATPAFDSGFNPQIITDSFFESWLGGTTTSRADLIGYLGVGSGGTAATASDTTITQVGTRIPRYASSDTCTVSGNELLYTTEYRSTQGQIIGTIGEVGAFQNPTGGLTNMRSLIKVSGVPTTITLTSMDFLYVQWRIKSTVALTDTTGTIFIGGVNYNWTMRPCYWTSSLLSSTNPFIYPSGGAVNGYLGFNTCVAYTTQTLGAVTSGPAGPAINFGATPFSTNTYTAGSKQRKMTYKFNITQGNHASGIGSISLYNSSNNAGYQISFAAVSGGDTIPKDNTKELTLGFTFSYGR